MTREILQTVFEGTWIGECVQYLDDEFFNPNKEVRFMGEIGFWWSLEPETTPRAYRTCFIRPTKPQTMEEKIKLEREYRSRLIRILPQNEADKLFLESGLEESRKKETRLIRKLEGRNAAVGDVDKARSFPIENLIEFKNDFARCLWHNDKSPSLHFIRDRNIAYCFSCGRGFDSIHAAQKVWGTGFREAIKRLM